MITASDITRFDAQQHSSKPDVASAALAEALADLVAATRRDIAASADALCLLPEADTAWPNGYDFEALERAREEEWDARVSLQARLDATESILAAYHAQSDGETGGAK